MHALRITVEYKALLMRDCRKWFKHVLHFGCACFFLSGLVCASAAWSAPSEKPIKLVVGFGAGGAMDTLARALAIKLSEHLRRPVYVENKLGAGGSIAANYVAQAKPDGATLLVASPAELFINQMFHKSARLADVGQLVPVAKISAMPIVLATTSDSHIQQIADIPSLMRKQGQGLSFASSGNGSSQHLAGEIFKQALGVDLVHVPYSGGPSATASLLGKQVDLLFAGIAPIAPYIESKKIRVLAVASGNRSAMIPEVPTLKEAGISDVSLEYWQGIFLPKNAPQDVVRHLSNALNFVVKDPDLVRKLELMGYVVNFKEAAAFGEILEQEKKGYQRVASEMGRQRLQ